ASGWRAAPLPGGGRTLWIASKGFRLRFHSPFQDFSCRKGHLSKRAATPGRSPVGPCILALRRAREPRAHAGRVAERVGHEQSGAAHLARRRDAVLIGHVVADEDRFASRE